MKVPGASDVLQVLRVRIQVVDSLGKSPELMLSAEGLVAF